MKRFTSIFIVFLLLFISDDVMAAKKSTHWCDTEDKTMYEISYDTKYVGEGDIYKENILLGYVKGHENDKNYKIESFATSQSCSVSSSGIVTACPSASALSVFTNDAEYSTENLKANGLVKINYNFSTGKFDIKIAKELSDKYYIRKSPTLNEDNDKDSRNYNGFYKDYYPNNQYLGSNNTFTAKPGESVILEYYVKGGGCNGAFLASQHFKMENTDDILVDNPALTNSNSYIYKMCDKYVRKNPNYLNDATSVTIKKSIVPICYKKVDKDGKETNKITITEYNKIDADDVIKSTTKLDKLLLGMSPLDSDPKPNNATPNSNKSCSSGTGQIKCNNSYSNSSTFNAYANSDFSVTCTDTYSFKGDSPKLTYAGGGFEYGSGIDYSIVRKCSISFIGSRAVKPLQCTGRQCISISTYLMSDGSTKVDYSGAGPNEDFDSCINNCDGGEYSQSCINSCYKEIYGENTKRNDNLGKMSTLILNEPKGKINSLLNYENKNYTVKKVDTYVLPNGVPVTYPTGYSVTNIQPGQWISPSGTDRYGYTYDLVDSGGNVVGSSHASSNYCAQHAGSTEWSCHDVPSGCIWNAEEVYQARLSAIRSNHSAAVNAMVGAIGSLTVGKVDLTIVDSYLKNKNGKNYTFSINNYDSDLKLKLNVYYPNSGTPSGGSAVIGERNETVSLAGVNGAIGVNNIQIDESAYIGKTYGNVAYKSGNRYFTISKNKDGNYGINTLNDFKTSEYYNGNTKSGNSKYFTSLFTNNKNVKVDSNGNVSLNLDCYNIELSVSGFGTSNKNYSFSNSCYYGVYNNYIYTDDDCDGSDKNSCPDGVKYIFRPIELTDVFPDREPRWNWTNNASLNLDGNDPYLGYNVNPVKTTEHIEDAGHTIIADSNHELDYEIIIDRAGIARIKRFNKDMGNYTNFDLNCVVRGINLCRSNFLDSATYIRNAGQTRINATIGTNND